MKINFYFKNWLNENDRKNNIYKEDIPLNGENPIKNESVVNVVINNIKDFLPNKAFIIAINSEWGQGKTTFLKRVDCKLKKQEKTPITFWFNAWQHQKEESIIQNFLALLKKELSKYDGNANSYVNEYLNELLSIKDNSLTKGIKFFSQNILSNNSIHNSYNDINNVISKIDKQIIVFVDDLDRLNSSEISESLRVLRSVANFKNIIFICGVDIEYLKTEGNLKGDYLDKIFNLEINLPKNNKKYYLEELFELINNTDNSILTLSDKKELNKTLYSTENRSFSDLSGNILSSIFISELEFTVIMEQGLGKRVNSGFLNPSFFFNSSRDVKRFYNQLTTNKQLLKTFDNVNLYDYLLFQLLIFKNSWIINSFSDKHINLCFGGGETIIELHSTTYKSLIKKPELDEVNKRIVNFILDRLFSNNTPIKEKGIKHRIYLEFYTKNNVLNERIDHSDFLTAFKNHEIKELINTKFVGKEHSDDNINDIKKRLLKREYLITKADFEQILNLIKDNTFKNVYYQDIIDIINTLEQKLTKQEEVLDILDNLIFTEFDNPFEELLLHLNWHYTNFNKDEPVLRKSISLEYLNKEYVKDKVISLFNSYLLDDKKYSKVKDKLVFCTKEYFHTPDFSIYYDEIKEPFKDYFSKKIFTILNDVPPHNYGRWIIDNYSILSSIFNDDDKEVIKDAKHWSKVKEGPINFNKREFTKIGMKNLIKFIENLNDDFPKKVSVRINRMIKEIGNFINNDLS